MKKMLEARQISKSYPNGCQALQSTSFELHSGELVGLIGPNGAGKSTLIHVLCGILKPTSGNVLRELKDPTKVAWVSQTASLDWYLSVYENALMGAKMGGLRGEKARACALKWLNHLELRDAQHLLRPDQLSGGQQRRLQVARALAQEPELIFLDEPTTGLDPVASRVVMQELKMRVKQGASILISSHELSLVEEFASHLLWMDRGKVTFDAGSVEEASLQRRYEMKHGG